MGTEITSRKGFASMDPVRQREIASRGGKAAHAKGTAHTFTASEAREAGQKGGRKVAQDRAHMSAIGKVGRRSRTQKIIERRQGVSPG